MTADQTLPDKTQKQKAIDTLVQKRFEQSEHAKASPIVSALKAAGHVLGGIVAASMSVFGGLKLGFPWWASASGFVLAFYIASPILAQTAISWLLGAIRDAITARKGAE